MRRTGVLLLLVTVLLMAVPVSGTVTLTINASPVQAPVGDMVTLSGTVNGTPSIAVYLFVTGPSLDTRGVVLDNLNIPAGRGMFTTAPVQLSDGTWTYAWDTSAILGTLRPGHYTVYVVDSPVDRLRSTKTEYATVEVDFLPARQPVSKTPLHPLLPVIALAGAGCLLGIFPVKRQ